MKVYYQKFDIWEKNSVDIESATEFETDRDIHSADKKNYDEWEVEWLLEEICKDYFHNRDGLDMADSWNRHGIVIALWDCDKKLVGLYETELEYDPVFNISKVRK